jgi:uncharacterized protein (DUF924 family)
MIRGVSYAAYAVLFVGAAYILNKFPLDHLTNIQMLTRLAARSTPRFFRSSITSQRAMSSFTLDKDIFKPALYKELQNVWFEGIELGAKDVDMSVAKRWFAASAEDKIAFDGLCREKFGHALEAVGPEKFPAASAEPFLRELREVAQADPQGVNGAEGAWTAISMVLMLDQISRNIFRTNECLAKVYNHYDKISYSLMQSLLSPDSPIGRPDLHPQWRASTVHRLWFLLPLVHSEKISAHDQYDEIMASLGEVLEKEGASGSMKMFWDKGLESEKEHREILERFGRYPHRNEALGRATTEEERKFLEEGGATFGVAQEKKA